MMNASRIHSLDFLKCFAALCVVFIHYGDDSLAPLVRCAVPVFFMITGYNYSSMSSKGRFWLHLRKLVCMLLWASLLYAMLSLFSSCENDTFKEWLEDTFSLRNLAMCLFLNKSLFGWHLWYFYAVLYDLLIFHYGNKWGWTSTIRYLSILSLLFLFFANFTSWHSYMNNFLFMGLPCMVVGDLLHGNEIKISSLVSCKKSVAICCTLLVALFTEKWLLGVVCGGNSVREMYIFTLPLVFIIFCLALKYPNFGKNTIFATIGIKYSANIYILHVSIAMLLVHVISNHTSIEKTIFSVSVFVVSLFAAWGLKKCKIFFLRTD